MFIGHPVERLEIGANAVFEAFALIGEQLHDGTFNEIVPVKYAEQQMYALSYLEAMFTH
jgi:hypothetical protein